MAMDIRHADGIHSISKIKVIRNTSCAEVIEEVLALNVEKIPTNPNTWYRLTFDTPIRGQLESMQIVLRQTPRFNTLFRVNTCQDVPLITAGEELLLDDLGVGGMGGSCGGERRREEDFWVPIQLNSSCNASSGNLAHGINVTVPDGDVHGMVLYLNSAGTFTLDYCFNGREFHQNLRKQACEVLYPAGIRALGVSFNPLVDQRAFGRRGGIGLGGCNMNERKVQITNIA